MVAVTFVLKKYTSEDFDLEIIWLFGCESQLQIPL